MQEYSPAHRKADAELDPERLNGCSAEHFRKRRNVWRTAASATAGISLVVFISYIAGVREQSRSYGTKVLAMSGDRLGMMAEGKATAERLEALANAQARDILSTEHVADPHADAALAASILKMQASTWAKKEAQNLAATLASAIRTTDHAAVAERHVFVRRDQGKRPSTQLHELDALHHSDPLRYKDRQQPFEEKQRQAHVESAAPSTPPAPVSLEGLLNDALHHSDLLRNTEHQQLFEQRQRQAQVESVAPSTPPAPVPLEVVELFKKQEAKDAAHDMHRVAEHTQATHTFAQTKEFSWPHAAVATRSWQESDRQKHIAVAARQTISRRAGAAGVASREPQKFFWPAAPAKSAPADAYHQRMHHLREWLSTRAQMQRPRKASPTPAHQQQLISRALKRLADKVRGRVLARQSLGTGTSQVETMPIRPLEGQTTTSNYVIRPSSVESPEAPATANSQPPVALVAPVEAEAARPAAAGGSDTAGAPVEAVAPAAGTPDTPPPISIVAPGEQPPVIVAPGEQHQPPVSIVAPGEAASPAAAAPPGTQPSVAIVAPGEQEFWPEASYPGAGGGGSEVEGQSEVAYAGPRHLVPHEASSGAVQIVVPTETASGNYNYVSTPETAGGDDGSQGGAVRVGAACAQNPSKVGGEDPRQCAVWAQPAWGHMKKLPVGSSPQVANGCIQYVCRSVRAKPQEFLDQSLGLLIESVVKHCADGANYLFIQFDKIWKNTVHVLLRLWGQETAAEHADLDQQVARGFKLAEVDKLTVDPETIKPGTVMKSMVYGCMYPFMNCKNQLYMAKHLCQDDGYWIRSIHDFNCTGGFIASSTGNSTKWKYVDHFALSAILLLGLVLLGVFARSYAMSRNRDMDDRRFWWMHNSSTEDDAQGKEIIQITL